MHTNLISNVDQSLKDTTNPDRTETGPHRIGWKIARELGSIAEGLANFIGAGKAVRHIAMDVSDKSGQHIYTASELNAYLAKLIAAAQSSGANALDYLERRVNALPYQSGFAAAAMVKQAREQLNKKIKQQKAQNAAIDVNAAEAQSRLNNVSTYDTGEIISGRAHNEQSQALDAASKILNVDKSLNDNNNNIKE